MLPQSIGYGICIGSLLSVSVCRYENNSAYKNFSFPKSLDQINGNNLNFGNKSFKSFMTKSQQIYIFKLIFEHSESRFASLGKKTNSRKADHQSKEEKKTPFEIIYRKV